jgi:hypothetical protein
MKHFNAVRWSGCVNHLAGIDRQEMQGHRGARRKHCVQTTALWQRVADAAVVEARHQPAPEKVRFVKAAFALAGPAAKQPEMRGVVIQLLYDSFAQPFTVGIRSAPRRIRQLLYRAEPYQIDLQIELRPEGNRLVVTGQLLDVSRPEMVGRDVQVMLSDGREYMVNTVTNEFGEFRAEVQNSGDLELTLLSPGGKPIVVLVRGALERTSGSEG